MTAFTVFDADGVILRTGSAPDNMIGIQAMAAGESVLPIQADQVTQYISNGQVADKLPIQATLTANPITRPARAEFTNLPATCDITVNGQTYPCTAGFANIGFNLPGVFPVRVSALHMIDQEFSVEVL